VIGGASIGGGVKVKGLDDVIIKGGLKRNSTIESASGTPKKVPESVTPDITDRIERIESDIAKIKSNLSKVGKID
jgi:hypothetical protein